MTNEQIQKRIQKQLDKVMPGLRAYVFRHADNPNKYEVAIDVTVSARFSFHESERAHLSDYIGGQVANALDDLADHMEPLRQ